MPATAKRLKRGFEWFRPFGRTNLRTSCLAIGGGGMISSDDVLYAFDKGIRTFFFSSDLHHFAYRPMVEALRKLCGRGASHRDEVTLFTVTYGRTSRLILSALFDQFAELKIDSIDMLYWGWTDTGDEQSLTQVLDHRAGWTGPGSPAHRALAQLFGETERMKQHGVVRHIGASFHSMELAHTFAQHPGLDGAMVRFNAAHRRAAREFFPTLPARKQRPGVMTFKSMASQAGPLWTRPPNWTHEWTPEPGDLYRYALSQPTVDVVLTGPMNRRDIDQSIAAVEKGPLSQEELELVEAWGDAHRARLPPRPAAPQAPRASKKASQSTAPAKKTRTAKRPARRA
ncbi:MAG TPA: hypothetical protein VF815_12660 [Myxococcaceae bacterium]|jgi:hypothetical protein